MNNSPYQQRLESRSREAFVWFVVILACIFIGGWLWAYDRATHPNPLPNPDRIDTGWIEEHSEIPEDTATFSTRARRRKGVDSLQSVKKEDSL